MTLLCIKDQFGELKKDKVYECYGSQIMPGPGGRPTLTFIVWTEKSEWSACSCLFFKPNVQTIFGTIERKDQNGD